MFSPLPSGDLPEVDDNEGYSFLERHVEE